MTILRDRLYDRLRAAMRERDRATATVLRSVLGALANAEAIAVRAPTCNEATGRHVAGGVVGLGAAEAERRELTEEDERAIVAAELAELRTAIRTYAAAHDEERATSARAGLRALEQALDIG